MFDLKINKTLNGIDAISVYAKRSIATVLYWIQSYDFPAEKIDGIWVSNTSGIRQWKKSEIGRELLESLGDEEEMISRLPFKNQKKKVSRRRW